MCLPFYHGIYDVLAYVSPFFHGFSMVFPWFFHGFFPWFCCRGADDFPQVVRTNGARAVRVQTVKGREHGLLTVGGPGMGGGDRFRLGTYGKAIRKAMGNGKLWGFEWWKSMENYRKTHGKLEDLGVWMMKIHEKTQRILVNLRVEFENPWENPWEKQRKKV